MLSHNENQGIGTSFYIKTPITLQKTKKSRNLDTNIPRYLYIKIPRYQEIKKSRYQYTKILLYQDTKIPSKKIKKLKNENRVI